jgi:hypothetical protein
LVVTCTGRVGLRHVVRHIDVTTPEPARDTDSIHTRVSVVNANPLICAWSVGASRRSSVACPAGVSSTTRTVPSTLVATPAEISLVRNTRGVYAEPSTSTPGTSTGGGPDQLGAIVPNGSAAGPGSGAGSASVSTRMTAATATANTSRRPTGSLACRRRRPKWCSGTSAA